MGKLNIEVGLIAIKFNGDKMEITIKIEIPDEDLKYIDIEEITKKIKKEIERKISVMKLYGRFKKEDVEKAMKEVEEEWGL